jgi:hypothetical protein
MIDTEGLWKLTPLIEIRSQRGLWVCYSCYFFWALSMSIGETRLRFRVLRRDMQHTDVTRRSFGTRYTLFFGSGVPNDPNAAQIVGYGEGINPMTFRTDDERSAIVAPSSIGHLNYFTVLVFARNAAAVGWEQFKLVRAAAPDLSEP